MMISRGVEISITGGVGEKVCVQDIIFQHVPYIYIEKYPMRKRYSQWEILKKQSHYSKKALIFRLTLFKPIL